MSPTKLLLPTLLIGVALASVLTFQLTEIQGQQKNITATLAEQSNALETVRKINSQLEALVVGTSRLAQNGNPHAQTLVNQLREAGITIKEEAPAPSAQTQQAPVAANPPAPAPAPVATAAPVPTPGIPALPETAQPAINQTAPAPIAITPPTLSPKTETVSPANGLTTVIPVTTPQSPSITGQLSPTPNISL